VTAKNGLIGVAPWKRPQNWDWQDKYFLILQIDDGPEVRHSIITGNYTHIWISAEVNYLVPGKGKKRKQTRRKFTVYDESDYRDAGSFTSVLQNDSCLG
jgi:hypothetical protein